MRLNAILFLSTFFLQFHSIDITNLTNGVYLYVIETNNQQVKKDKLIITK